MHHRVPLQKYQLCTDVVLMRSEFAEKTKHIEAVFDVCGGRCTDEVLLRSEFDEQTKCIVPLFDVCGHFGGERAKLCEVVGKPISMLVHILTMSEAVEKPS